MKRTFSDIIKKRKGTLHYGSFGEAANNIRPVQARGQLPRRIWASAIRKPTVRSHHLIAGPEASALCQLAWRIHTHTTHTTRSHRYAVSCPLPTCRGFWASGLPCPAGAPARPPTLARMARRRRTAPAGAACVPFGPSKRAGHWPAAAARPRQTTRFAEKPHAAQCTPTPDAHESQRYSGLLLTNNQGQTVGK
jgi:hypothetical protein